MKHTGERHLGGKMEAVIFLQTHYFAAGCNRLLKISASAFCQAGWQDLADVHRLTDTLEAELTHVVHICLHMQTRQPWYRRLLG